MIWMLASATVENASAPGHHGPVLTPDAPTLFEIAGLPVTNSMVYSWVIIAVLFIVIRAGTRNLSEIPSGLQNVIEAMVEFLENLTSSLLEPKVVRWCFPVVSTFFIFILVSNLAGLLPGVGSIGWGTPVSPGSFFLQHADKPLFRPPTADANTTVAMALVFFVMSTWWALKYNGPGGLFNHIFGLKGGLKGLIAIPLAAVFFAVGLIEVIAILIRPVALSMRLYGNIYGGEMVLTTMLAMPGYGLAAVPFYFLELIVAVVQALVFTLLCIAFIGTLCSHTDDGHGEAAHGHGH